MRFVSLITATIFSIALGASNVTNTQDCITRGKNCPRGPKPENPCCQTNYPVYCLDGICIEITTEEDQN
jgi:hypothetical protein